ncbi:membrane protein insertion efficiency factor YidD [Nostoc sp. CMAA1605]|uniref:membrane protein insertion efficiency factor YidD n=1 Tax=Nostoc sp. CMAA1605 TaxID=2055159 RepID=UPI001F42E537|nr:membrane protein insertion efficiency factor YidD [Nostoc sp. CMAA1605]MCF4970038.1 membrane protein insertion efficiency factor YidD [Nostoc sp. CMAA1605]
MNISLFDSWSRNLSTVAITGYQKYLSPHKGFSCAHRVLYGGESCSQYIKRVISEEGLSVALVKSRQRFQECKQANLLLRSRLQIEDSESTDESDDSSLDEEDTSLNPRRKVPPSGQTSNTDCGDLPDCSSLDCSGVDCGDLPDCSSLDCSGADCHFPDCGDLTDCGSLDCGSLDCGSADCGSCGN